MIDLKAFRKDNKLTQDKAAVYFGCNQSFISQIESGLRPVPEAFISRVKADISVDAKHMTPEENELEAQPEMDTQQMVPAKFVDMLFAERKLHDQKELELLSQNRDLIDILKNQISDIKKIIAPQENDVVCAIASGSGLVR